MYTSDKNEIMHYTDSMLHDAFLFLAAAIVCAVFGQIYEIFSHEVYSFYMIYAFLIPLVPGAFLNLLIVWHAIRKARHLQDKEDGVPRAGIFFPGRFSRQAWNSGLAALTVGCLFRGVLDIYGTTNRLVVVYPIAAAALMGVGVFSFIMSFAAFRKIRRNMDSMAA